MSIYVSKNNRQTGPFDEAKILEMLESEQLVPSDFAIRQGDKEWSRLADLFPHAKPETAVAAAQTPMAAVASTAAVAPKKSRKGLLLGCGGFLVVAVLVTSVLGFFGYRNMFPADSKDNLPDAVKTSVSGEFKLNNRYPPKGNIWGSEQNFVGIYENDTKKSVIYMMTVYSDNETAQKALQTELARTCQTGEKTMEFSFEANGKEVSKAKTCAVPLYVIKDNKLVALGGAGASVDTWIEFAENLPFNGGAKMKRK